ncbi:MAG TPA: carboxypeptidase-like regulatory domain-containing protein, partial [Cyclobacteriaceae bacterium]
MLKVYSQKTSTKNSFALALITLLLICCFGMTESFGQQKAIVKGTVKDDSGQTLPGVNVVIAGGYSGTSTDPRGEYSIFVTPGKVELEFSFIGNETKKESFEIAAGETKVLDVVLVSSVVQLNEVFIIGSLEGQQKALNQQRTADNIKNIVAADQIGRFPDQNSAEALQRVPGINVQRDEGDGRFVLVRGLAPQYTNISVNGEQIPSPDAGARFVALDAIPANQLASLEVTKAITPDMDGDAIGGSVNLVTQTASSQELQLSASLGLEYNANASKVAPQGNLSISKRSANNKFGFIANGSYAQSKKKSDRYNFDGWDDEPNGLSEFVPGDYEITRNRIGLSATLDYKFNEKNSIYLRSLYSELRELELRREFQFVSEYDEDLDVTEYEVKKELKDRPENQGVYSFNLGGTSVGSKLKFDYEVAYAKAFQDTPWNRYTVFENSEDVEWGMDLETRLNPKITGFIFDGAAADYTNSDLYEFDSYEESSTLAEDQNITAKVNFAIPLALGENSGELKFGGKTRFKDKSYKFRYFTNYSDYSGAEDLSLTNYQGSYTDETFMNDDFGPIGYFAARGFGKFVKDNIGDFDEIEDVEDEVAMESYEASENVYAAYVQGKIQF